MNNKRGISMLEVIVILAIIGLFGVLAAIALDSARERARDAKRLADIARIQASLELYFNDNNAYPVVSELTPLGQVATGCLSGSGFVPTCDSSSESVYMEHIPSSPGAGLKDLSSCGGVSNSYCYIGTEDQYRIVFELENENPEAKLVSGLNCASDQGVKAENCPGFE